MSKPDFDKLTTTELKDLKLHHEILEMVRPIWKRPIVWAATIPLLVTAYGAWELFATRYYENQRALIEINTADLNEKFKEQRGKIAEQTAKLLKDRNTLEADLKQKFKEQQRKIADQTAMLLKDRGILEADITRREKDVETLQTRYEEKLEKIAEIKEEYGRKEAELQKAFLKKEAESKEELRELEEGQKKELARLARARALAPVYEVITNVKQEQDFWVSYELEQLINALQKTDDYHDDRVGLVLTEVRREDLGFVPLALFSYALYRSTDATEWRDKLFELLDESLAKAGDSEENNKRAEGMVEFASDIDWKNGDDKKAAQALLNYLKRGTDNDEFVRDVLFALHIMKTSDLHLLDQDGFLTAVQLARETLFNTSLRAHDRVFYPKTFLGEWAPQVLLVYAGKYFTTDDLRDRKVDAALLQDLLSDSLFVEVVRENSAAPQTSNAGQWAIWMQQEGNRQAVKLWLEPDLESLRKEGSEMLHQLQLWK